MCGIWGIISNYQKERTQQLISKLANKPRKRGPDSSRSLQIHNIYLAFHRLAINGLNEKSMQPFNYKNKYFLICNGEIYNHKTLEKRFGVRCETESDCEIILHMYEKIRHPVKFTEVLDGVFAFILYDAEQQKLIIGRDRYGIRPLYWGISPNKSLIFSSTLGGINDSEFSVRQFPPNTTCVIHNGKPTFYERPKYHKITMKGMLDTHFILEQLHYLLRNAVQKRLMSDRKICCLLSGGLDSSLITSIVCSLKGAKNVDTFSIGMEGGTDTKYAEEVAKFLGTNHTSVTYTKQEFLDTIREVIGHVETYDTTTIRASVGNYLISKYISENTDNIVVFNGDGSDELFGGYMYFHNSPNPEEYKKEIHNLLDNIHFYDVQRSDRSISSVGLEPRTPFLDHDLTSFWLSVSPELRDTKGMIEKWWLRKAFDRQEHKYLPDSILWRQKEAFSDGVSSKQESWGDSCKRWAEEYLHQTGYDCTKKQFPLLETQCYYNIFQELFPNKEKAIPNQLWMPKWSGNQIDPSARVLDVYNETRNNN